MKTDFFQSCGHCWVFQVCWHIECSTLTTLSFRIWNSSAAILSLPLALFLVMLPKAHLTSHSRISDSRWVTMPLWLYESLRAFLYSYSVYSCHLFLISSASLRSILFLSFNVPIFAWNVPLVSLIFLKDISVQSLSRVRLFLTPWPAECQASLSIINSRSLLKLMSINSLMPSNHLILCKELTRWKRPWCWEGSKAGGRGDAEDERMRRDV